jgi:hypothetical protein
MAVAHWKCIEDGVNRVRPSGPLDPDATRRFLEVVVSEGSRYPDAGKADFILKHGRAFTWRALPRGIQKAEVRHCLENACRLALLKPVSYTYVEGYAINRLLAAYPVAHAWCVDRKGFVIDPTWEEGVGYFGVPFRLEYLLRIWNETQCGLIDNEDMGYPLLTGAHAAVDAIKP